MNELTMALGEQMREGQLLDEEIKKQLLKVGFIVSDELVDFSGDEYDSSYLEKA